MPGGLAVADTRSHFADLFSVYAWVMIVVTVLVYGAVIFAVVRYRRRQDEYPRGKDKRTLLESVYALVLAVVAVTLVTLTFRTEDKIDPAASSGGIRVNLVAFQWQWQFTYPDFGKRVLGTPERVPTLVLPVNTLVRFDGVSRDVIHSFWIPAERFKRDEFPGTHTKFDLSFERTGTYIGRCAEFCGLHHTDMSFFVRVVPRDAFRRWVQR
ncbi:MAG TPA: cytochrome c oxidase subunit II [Gaiellaceae bacterium]|nr:cytochrome c oxidase subunit II [Gaiellaceae bacterium]